MTYLIKEYLKAIIKTITEIGIEVCNDIDIQEYSKNDFIVGIEIQESQLKGTDDFECIMFLNFYSGTNANLSILSSLVYNKINKIILENDDFVSTKVQFKNSLDVNYDESLKKYFAISTYKFTYRRKP